MSTIYIDGEQAYEYPKVNNYFVTKSGNIYSTYVKGCRGSVDISNPHRLSYGVDKDGYYRVVLSNNGNKKYIKVHTMVAETFIGEIISPYVVNHKDGDKHNNSVENLEIVTSAYNTKHAHSSGLCSREQKVLVRYHGEEYTFASIKACVAKFPDLTVHYLSQIKRGEILYSMVLFKKRSPSKRISKVDSYYNGEYYCSFDTLQDADSFFKKAKGSTSSAIKYSQYRERVNQYTVIFPNVSTIESTQPSGSE